MALSVPALAFVGSMPDEYRAAFDDDAINAHLAIVSGRRRGETRAEVWQPHETGARDVIALCVVADDRPGLLAQINAALVAHSIDVVEAHAFCRLDGDGLVEAVDFLWIRRAPEARAGAPLRVSDVPEIESLIVALAEGRVTFAGAVAVVPGPRARGGATNVRFEHDDRTGKTSLTIVAVDRPGLLLVVTKTLFEAGLQIVALRATTENGQAVDRFELAEQGGTPLRRDRMFALQTAILCAIDESGETRSVPPPALVSRR